MLQVFRLKSWRQPRHSPRWAHEPGRDAQVYGRGYRRGADARLTADIDHRLRAASGEDLKLVRQVRTIGGLLAIQVDTAVLGNDHVDGSRELLSGRRRPH